MSAFKFLKQVFGLSDDDYTSEKEQTEPYINPFKKETVMQETEKAESTAATEDTPADKTIDEEVMTKIIDMLNSGLPDPIKKFIDIEAEKQFVQQSFGMAFEKYADRIKEEISSKTKSQWQADRINLEQQSVALGNQLTELKAKNEELRNRITVLDKQKSAMNEQVAQANNKAATAEAERDQFQLECKSLMNKLKVSSVNEETLNTLKEENDSLSKELQESKAEITSLNKGIEDKEKENATLSERLGQLEANNKDDQKKIIESLQAEITKLTDGTYTLREQLNTAKENEESYQDEIAKMQQECEIKDNDISNLQATIASLEEKIADSEKRFAETEEKEAAIKELKGQIETWQSAESQSKEEIGRLNSLLESQRKEIESLNAQLEEKEQMIAFHDNIMESQKENEDKLRQQLEEYSRKNAELEKQLKPRKEEKVLLFNEPEETFEPTKKEHKKRERKTVSAIEPDYSDWLMPTPPTSEIPIDSIEPASTENNTKKIPERRHNAPSQMELF